MSRVSLLPGSELWCVRGHVEPLDVFSVLSAAALPGAALPRQARPCVSSLS